MLTRIRTQLNEHQNEEAGKGLDDAFLKLTGAGPDAISKMSETELLAKLTMDGPTNAVREKIYIVVGLLQEAARLHTAEGREDDGSHCLVKALNLLMMVQLENDDLDVPQFVPTIDGLRDQLIETPLPSLTLATLWRHYERIGAYARAEDALFDLLEAEPDNDALRGEAKIFYERLLRQSDRVLEDGNLPRAEVRNGLAEIAAKTH